MIGFSINFPLAMLWLVLGITMNTTAFIPAFIISFMAAMFCLAMDS